MCHVRTGTHPPSTTAHGENRKLTNFKVRVGHDSLVGEVIRIEADKATIQVYEETGTRFPPPPHPPGANTALQRVSPSATLFSERANLCPSSSDPV